MKKFSLILFILLLTGFSLLANQRPRVAVPAAPAVQESAAARQDSGDAEPSAREEAPQATPAVPAPQSIFPGNYDGMLQISEVMPKNKACLPDAQGKFYDWVELENVSGETLSLQGWALTDREGQVRWSFPDRELAPGERLLVLFDGEQGPGFSLSKDETLYLLSPDGQTRDAVLCDRDHADCSLIRQADGSFVETTWISPGFENSPAGYEAWCAQGSAGEALVIYEVAVYNRSFVADGNWDACDWVEIKNVSDETVSLSGCTLSDKSGEARFTFPDRELAPGEILLVCCHDDEEDGSIGHALNTGFDLSAANEQLFLRDGSGALLDYASLHDIPIGGSMGRTDGQPGFFYFAKSTPGRDNEGGVRRVAAMPEDVTAEGVYNDVENVTVELSAEGEIHYTTDGTVPTLDSPVYSEPLVLSSTTVVRAITKEDGALVSPVATYSYIINENHTLPVLSLVVDDYDLFQDIWYNKRKHVDVPSNLALYDGEHSFNHACDLSMKGYTSLDLPKKSMGVSFKGRYGGNLECDVFGNGILEFSSLAIRAGQDYTFSIFRNEMFQELCSEMGGACLTQASKYCILYLNGRYYGIYCLKEDFSKQYYASHAGVSVKSVVANKCPVGLDSEFYAEVLDFIYHNDMTIDENYQYICDHVDVDSLIDWFLIEAYCANTDIQGNTRMYRSPENGNKWTFCFYDADWGFWYSGSDFTLIMEGKGNVGNQMPPLIRKLLQNRYFRDRVLYRFAELNRTVLSNDHVLEKIDKYQALLEPEIERERKRWYLHADQWYVRVDELRHFIKDNNWEMHNINQICKYLHVGEMERQQIFGR